MVESAHMVLLSVGVQLIGAGVLCVAQTFMMGRFLKLVSDNRQQVLRMAGELIQQKFCLFLVFTLHMCSPSMCFSQGHSPN